MKPVSKESVDPAGGDRDRDPGRDHFATTRWSLVVCAGRRSSPDSERALAELCRVYWYPVYAYVRRRGAGREDAEDLTQGFFARLLKGDDLRHLDAQRGRFRAFLLASMKHFLANARDHGLRRKRGGGVTHVSWDWEQADERFQLEGAVGDSPDRAYDREWAVALLARVMERLGIECAASGREALYRATRSLLMGDAAGDDPRYTEVAKELGSSEGAVRVAVHRLRKRYRAILREEIAGTLADPGQAAEELRSLRAALESA